MALLLAASVTPLRDGGAALDEDAIAPMVDFLAAGGVDGLFALGTTGEGVLLSLEERMRAAVAFREACAGTLIVHCGAQSTADTVALAGPRRVDRRRRRGGDPAALLPLRARRRAGPSGRRGGGLRPRPVLPVRLRGPERLPARAVGGRAPARPRRATSPASRSRRRRSTASLPTSSSGSRSTSAPSRSSRRGSRPARPAPSRGWRQRSPRSSPRSSARPTRRERLGFASCATRSSAFRSRPRSRSPSAPAASRSRQTSAPRSIASTSRAPRPFVSSPRRRLLNNLPTC